MKMARLIYFFHFYQFLNLLQVCISILHPPIDDPQGGELPGERWNPTQSVRTVLISIISLLNEVYIVKNMYYHIFKKISFLFLKLYFSLIHTLLQMWMHLSPLETGKKEKIISTKKLQRNRFAHLNFWNFFLISTNRLELIHSPPRSKLFFQKLVFLNPKSCSNGSVALFLIIIKLSAFLH